MNCPHEVVMRRSQRGAPWRDRTGWPVDEMTVAVVGVVGVVAVAVVVVVVVFFV